MSVRKYYSDVALVLYYMIWVAIAFFGLVYYFLNASDPGVVG